MKTFSWILFVGLAAAVMAVPLAEGTYPVDPTADIAWLSSCGYSGVTSIQCAFNNARSEENDQLDISLPMITMPSQATWDAMSDGEKVFWLTNRERIDRGVNPLMDVETNVTAVAQTYANCLLETNCWNHNCCGSPNPQTRLVANPAIEACYDLPWPVFPEALSYLGSSGGAIALPVERSVYEWMYADAVDWGHRHTILGYPYNDNSGIAGKEGFLGIGRASGGPYQGCAFAEIIVLNVFDPCASWADADGDGITDDEDNCPMNDNPAQEDMDGDDVGDVCDTCTDTDNDGFGNSGFPINTCALDNCPDSPNGPYGGTCTAGTIGQSCINDGECGVDGFCSMKKEDMDGDCIGDACDPEPEVYDPSVPDIKPPGGNGCGDACECHADCDSDGKVQLSDLVIMKQQFMWNCSAHLSCEADCNYSGTVDLADLVIMKYEFMRTDCPACA